MKWVASKSFGKVHFIFSYKDKSLFSFNKSLRKLFISKIKLNSCHTDAQPNEKKKKNVKFENVTKKIRKKVIQQKIRFSFIVVRKL